MAARLNFKGRTQIYIYECAMDNNDYSCSVFFFRDIYFGARDIFRKNGRDIEKKPVTILDLKKWP